MATFFLSDEKRMNKVPAKTTTIQTLEILKSTRNILAADKMEEDAEEVPLEEEEELEPRRPHRFQTLLEAEDA